MKTKVLLALDTFFHQWDSEQRTVWLGIQPYINGSPSDVANWISSDQNIHDGSASEFEIASPGIISASAIPVPLPSNLSIKVVFFDAQSAQVLAVEINRQSHCKLLKPEHFRHLNKFSTKQDIAKSVNINEEMNAHAYPYVFNSQLKQSLQAKSSPNGIDPVTAEEMAEQLVMKFELGDREKYDDTCFSNLGMPFNATHPHDPIHASGAGNSPLHATNTHYLMGQLLRLGGDIALLKRIKSFAFYINGNNCVVPDSNGTTERIFSTLSASFTPDDYSQSITWSNKLAHRINAKVQGDNFSVTKLPSINRFIWRLGTKEQTTTDAQAMVNSVRWKAFERLDIREKSDVEKPLLINEEFEEITFTPAITFDVSLSRYRKTPDVMEDSSGRYPTNCMVVSVQPSASQKARFDSLMQFPKFDISTAKFFALAVTGKVDDKNTRNIDYEITPNALKYVDFPWDDGKELLLFFNTEKSLATNEFPDDIDFNFNDHVYQNAVLLVQLPPQMTLQRKGVDTKNDRQHFIDRTNPFGPRWEYWHTELDASLPDFDALMCAKLDNTHIDLDQLVVSVFHNDKYDYELAQSARRLEVVVKAEFKNIRETDSKDPNSFDFDQVIIEDKTNHNRLNLYEQRMDYMLTQGGIESKQRITHRNESSALPSIKEIEEDTLDPLKKNLYYTFMAVMKDSTSAHQDSADTILQQQVAEQIGRTAYSVKDFYVDVYENIGDGRDLFFNLEHTYGSTILESAIKGVPNCIDEPILLATEVAFTHTPESGPPERMRLFEISLSMDSGIETVTLHVNKQLLESEWAKRTAKLNNPPNALETSKALTHIQAWQAFAEMYYAQAVDLVAECYEFDIHKLTMNKRNNGLQEGLVKTEIKIPQATQAIKELVASVFTDLSNANIGFTLPTHNSWSTNCHAVRFRLDVTRREDFVPEADPNYWEVHRRLAKEPEGGIEQLYDVDGAATQRLSNSTINKQINRYLMQLKKSSGYIHPFGLDNNKTRNEQFFALIGDGITPEHAIPNNNAWIIPAAIKREAGEIELAYCPIGIMPIANDPYLKQNTSQTMRRYFEALQSVIDFEQYAWFKEDAESLASKVNELMNENVKARYQQLIVAAAGKFKPLPDPSVDMADLVSPVRDLAKNGADLSHPLGQALRQHIHTIIDKQPILFGTLKSLALIDVNSTDGQAIRKDFFNLFMDKNVNERDFSVEGYLSPQNLLQKSNQQLTFVEQLDDHQYDNGFGFNAFRGETAERVFEQKPVGETDPAFQINTKDNMLNVPAGDPMTLSQAEVRLASRRPVKNPILGTVKQTSIQQNISKKFLPLSDLLSGRISVLDTPNSDKDLAPQISSVKAYTKDFDKVVVSASFKIEGDEESSNVGLTNAFENDAFFIVVSSEAITKTSTFQTAVPPTFSKLVANLENALPFALQASIADNVLNDENLKYCTNIIGRTAIQRALPKESHRQSVFRIEDDELEGKLKIIDIPIHRAEQSDYRCSVYLFKNNFQDVVLWLEVEIPIWESKYISLVQTRNQAPYGDNQQRIFAPEFATISQAIGDTLHRMTKTHHMRDQFNRIKIENTPKSPMLFIREVLGHKIGNIDESFGGKTNLLNVTIKEDSSSAFPSNISETKVNIFNGSFAVKMHQVEEKDWVNATIAWFPEDSSVKRWRIDIEWRDPKSNDEILRIEDIPVYLA